MTRQGIAANRLFSVTVLDPVAGPVRVWRQGGLSVSASAHGIFTCSGAAQEWSSFTSTDIPPSWSGVALVKLAAIVRYRLQHGLRLMSEDEERRLLSAHPRIAPGRPLCGNTMARIALRQAMAELPSARPGRAA